MSRSAPPSTATPPCSMSTAAQILTTGSISTISGAASTRSHDAGRIGTARDHPVESSGELRYDAPDRLEKRTLLPRPEDLVLAGGVLTMERGGHSRVLDLQRYPQVQPFVESIRATLAGDRGALERIFRVDFAGDVQRWSLTLVPLDGQLLRAVKQVQIDGSRDQLLRVEIRQPDGDRSLMTLRAPAPP